MTATTQAHTRFLRRSEAAQYVHDVWGYPLSPKTLAKWAVVGGGPTFRKAGRFPLYDPAQLDEWVKAKLSRPVKSTSELTGVGGV
jgi:hypothetical protein